MKAQTSLGGMVETFWKLVTVVVVSCFSLMLAIMAIQVLSRYVFGIAVSWTDEASRYFFLAEIFLGAALAQRHHEHIRVTVVTDLLPARTRRVVAGVADVVCIAVSAMLLTGAFHMMERTAGVYASTFDLSFSYIYLVQAIGVFLMMLLLLRDLYVKIVAAPGTATEVRGE